MKKVLLLTLGVAFTTTACGDDPVTPNPQTLSVTLAGLATLTEGTYEGWVIDQAGNPNSTGTFTLNANGMHQFTTDTPDPMMFVLTVEPPNDSDPAPSDQKILGGPFVNGIASLTALGFVSTDAAADFSSSPGTHVLLTPTTATATDDDGGIWLLNPPAPGGAPTGSVTLPVLASGWVYEGWVVFELGTAQQVAISYGKFRPQADGSVTGRDANAAGAFSGAPGDLTAGPPFPGGDFVMANGNAVPTGITLPVDFNGDDAVTGDSQWTHVISIEPAFDEGEAELDAVPFLLKPFGDPFGDGGPTDARTINQMVPLPTGTATIAN